MCIARTIVGSTRWRRGLKSGYGGVTEDALEAVLLLKGWPVRAWWRPVAGSGPVGHTVRRVAPAA